MSEFKEILQQLEPISLKEMDSVKLMNRVDTKFAFSLEFLESILPHLSENYKILEIKGTRSPYYESLYFDDSNMGFYSDHHNEKTDRYKVRIRNYTESDLFFLEVKHKIKGRTDKSRIKVKEMNETLDQDQLSFLSTQIPNIKNLEPALFNSFNRLTLVNKNMRERLTLDFNIRFTFENATTHFEQLVIAELKQEKVDRNAAFYALMKKLKVRPYRLSKYCIGVIELFESKDIKVNRFKQKLIKLREINNKITHVA